MEWKIPSFLIVLFLAFSVVSPLALSEDISGSVTITGEPPSITIDEPKNRTYNTDRIDVDVDVEDEGDTFSCNVTEDGNIIKQIVDATDTASYTGTIYKNDGSHSVSVHCDDGGYEVNSSVQYSVDTSPYAMAGPAGIFLVFIPIVVALGGWRYLSTFIKGGENEKLFGVMAFGMTAILAVTLAVAIL